MKRVYPLHTRVESISLFFLAACIIAGLPTKVRGQEPASVHENVIATAKQGKLLGRRLPDGSAMFQNIPFAQPPVGELRWREPQPPKRWSGVRDATKEMPACIQTDLGRNSRDAKDGREDCLYLDIFTPTWPVREKLPVMVHIHGGSNYFFSGRLATQTLTHKGIVLVSINYRLGIFGFLAHPGLTLESSHHSSGNYAILDQIAALRWVHENIARFGGDPANVTIFGQSAGAIDIGMLLISPLSKGLFAKAICESGGPIPPEPIVPTLNEAEKTGEEFAALLGKPTSGREIAYLRSLSAQQVLDAGYRNTAPNSNGSPTRGSWLALDGWVIPWQPASALRLGKMRRVPLIIGNTAQEFSFTPSGVIPAEAAKEAADQLRGRVSKAFGAQASQALAFYGLRNSDSPPADPLLGTVETQFMTDTWYRCPATIASGWFSQVGSGVWQYQFEQPLPGSSSTRHAGELPYVYGQAQLPGNTADGPTFGPTDVAISQKMQAYWTNFAKRGTPNAEGLPVWPQFKAGEDEIARITSNGPVVVRNPRLALCNLYQLSLQARLPR